jgi:uncharacterized membrane protein YebE (DUF533 family)
MLNTVLNAALRGGLTNILGGTGRRGARGGGALGGMAGQAALAAALGMLLRRGGGGRLLKVGGVAALGMMAYKAWQEYQARQGAQAGAGQAGTPGMQTKAFDAPSADVAPNEAHEQALVVAMIAAAKADGHVDDNERAQIEQALRQAEGEASDPGLLVWLDAELKRPLDAAAVARPAQNDPELASKLYLASVIVAGIGNVSAGEQAWLDALARELGLPDELKASLQAQAAQLA